jgi:hypothetical protein
VLLRADAIMSNKVGDWMVNVVAFFTVDSVVVFVQPSVMYLFCMSGTSCQLINLKDNTCPSSKHYRESASFSW